MVQTVTGAVADHRLGRVLAHEHVLVLTVGLRAAYPQTFAQEEIEALCVRKLTALKAAGIDTLVDCTPFDLGRDAELLARVSRRSGLQIVAATGLLLEPGRFFAIRDPAEIAELFVSDVVHGFGQSGIRAGVIKCAVDGPEVSPALERVLRACAMAHRQTGAPITTHTAARLRTGEIQQRIFAEEGVDLSRVIIGHCGDTDDLDYLRRLLHEGSVIGMDRFGVDDLLPDERRIEVVAQLCREGYASQMVLSHDAHCWNDRQSQAQVRAKRPNWHYEHIPGAILPALAAAGVSEQDIETMLVATARRMLAQRSA